MLRTTDMQLSFHKCVLSDLDELVNLSRKTFVDAFEKYNNPKDFKNYIGFAFEKSNIASQLQNLNPSFYFVFKGGKLVGYSIELERIYVLHKFQGQQIGQQMLREAIKLALQFNKEYMWLGVWEKNPEAIRFYQKYGFTKFDTHPYYIGKDKQTDWLMRYDLTNFP